MNNNINLNPKYIPLFQSKDRYFVVTGGRGSGKSFGIALFLLNLTYEKGHKVLFSRYTLMSAQTSIIPEFIEKIDMMEKHSDFRITKDEIINLTTGSSIMFKGIRTSSGNQTAALKSLNGVTTFVLDEAEELINEDDFNKIDFSIRSQLKQNRCILVLNPATKEHWIYQRFFQFKGVEGGYNGQKDGTTYIHTTYLDNVDNLSDSFKEQLMEMKARNPQKFEHTVLGGWLAKAEGTIIRNWRVGDFQPHELMCYGQDYGFSNDLNTLVKISVDKENRRMFVKAIYGKTHMSTSEIAMKNKNECGSDLIICDNSEPRLTNELKQTGLNIKPTIKKKGSILSGIALMQDYQIIVDRDSQGIIRELNNYVWHEKGERPIEKWNHYLDAIRYGLQYLVQGMASGRYVIR
jgi:phage terminase large subunit|tara:strand:- start:441 stop:1655 length:1215 start_codon:yes stop_codon:yes gene_type:complete